MKKKFTLVILVVMVSLCLVSTVALAGSSHTINMTIPLRAGWNLVSVPLVLNDSSVNFVFPGTEVVYTWDATSKAYIVPSIIEPNKGYWVAILQDADIILTGIPVTRWTANLKAGSNMIGSVSSVADFSRPNDKPNWSIEPYAYLWDTSSQSYITVTTIEPGKGYWVKATQDCKLTIP